jgi:hypothetical protein
MLIEPGKKPSKSVGQRLIYAILVEIAEPRSEANKIRTLRASFDGGRRFSGGPLPTRFIVAFAHCFGFRREFCDAA